jgi:ketosteroid isomerase-like protein
LSRVGIASPRQGPEGGDDSHASDRLLSASGAASTDEWNGSAHRSFHSPGFLRIDRSVAVLHDLCAVARASYRAYVDKDRAAIEGLIAEDFRFTSPLDNRLDRKTYFERCWPNSATIVDFDFLHVVQDGDRVFVTYEALDMHDRKFRNTEILTIREGKIIAAEVYFGWNVPHPAGQGGFVDSPRHDRDSPRPASILIFDLERSPCANATSTASL